MRGAGERTGSIEMESGLAMNLLSGLAGSVLTMVGALLWDWFRQKEARKGLFNATVAECNYNLSILDQVTNGLVNSRICFKRMSVEFYKNIRQQAAPAALSKEFLEALSWLIVDLELFNKEADFIFNESLNKSAFVGELNQKPLCVVKTSQTHDIGETVKWARVGVKGSLEKLRKIAKEELNEED